MRVFASHIIDKCFLYLYPEHLSFKSLIWRFILVKFEINLTIRFNILSTLTVYKNLNSFYRKRVIIEEVGINVFERWDQARRGNKFWV